MDFKGSYKHFLDEDIMSLSKKDLKKYVVKMNKAGNRKLKSNIKNGEYKIFSVADNYIHNKLGTGHMDGKFRTKKNDSIQTLRTRAATVRNYLNSKTSGYSNAKKTKKKVLEGLRRKGVTEIQDENYDTVWIYFEETKKRYPGAEYYSLLEYVVQEVEHNPDVSYGEIDSELGKTYNTNGKRRRGRPRTVNLTKYEKVYTDRQYDPMEEEFSGKFNNLL